MERYLDLMLIRFGLIAGGLVVLALVVFAVALTLKRRGRLDEARRYAEPAVRAAARAAVRRLEGGPGRSDRRGGRR
ncbi:hypothetical protein [Streptomyces sp. NPDC053427]|uniref:hypothetical protein n=1 Tax=Streptomyces sp. NPDC053427 TaxID=3365701 RepID=UPI0037D465DC